VLTVASTQDETARGAALLIAYSLGLGVPFLVTGLALGRLTGVLGWFKRHSRGITLASAALLGVFGIVLMLNRLWWVTSELQQALDSIGLDALVTLG
jgi:cytochrome c-type biogenesis protein